MNVAKSTIEPPSATSLIGESQVAAFFLAATLVVYFAATPFYFLYEDDYFHVGIPATQSLTWIWEQIRMAWATWPQGRPALFTAEALEGGLINITGSVAAGYIPALVIVAANGYLAYRLFRLRLPQTASLIGALFCLISCADPHKILLTHMPIQFAITLNLVGVILYLKNRPVLAYLIAGSSLLIYEISFAIFACAELYYFCNGRIRLKRLLLAWTSWIAVAAALFAFRFFHGEARAIEAAGHLSELWQRIATNVFWGPIYGLENSYSHPLGQLLKRPHAWPLLVSILVVLGIALFVRARSPSGAGEPATGTRLNGLAAFAAFLVLALGPYLIQLKRTVFPGYMRPVSGYHLCFGVALGFGIAVLLAKCTSHPRFTKAIYVCLLVLGCASTYQNLLIQDDYARSARYQGHFWNEVRRTASDARPDDVILIPNQQLLETEYVLSNSWGVTHAWEVLFEQTGPLKDWSNIAEARPVTVFLVRQDWERHITRSPDGYVLQSPDYTPPGFQAGRIPLVDNHVIVLQSEFSGPFRRRTAPIELGQGKIQLKTAPEHAPENLKLTILAKYLFDRFVD